MAVFTLPSLNLVFKIIKDSFGAPKNTTRQAVMEKYHFVFVRDRVGRLADAQEFEHLEFPRRCFPDDLLEYLLASPAATVRVVGDRVVVRHVYTERRVTPLNIFLRDAGGRAARDAVLDYGNAIKDLAAADIFTGRHAAQEFRRDAKRAGHLLRLRRALPALGVPLPPDPAAHDRSRRSSPRSRGSTWVSTTSSPRSSRPFWLPPGPVRDSISRCARGFVRRRVLEGSAGAAGTRERCVDVSFPYPSLQQRDGETCRADAGDLRGRLALHSSGYRSASCSALSFPSSRASASSWLTSRSSAGSPQ